MKCFVEYLNNEDGYYQFCRLMLRQANTNPVSHLTSSGDLERGQLDMFLTAYLFGSVLAVVSTLLRQTTSPSLSFEKVPLQHTEEMRAADHLALQKLQNYLLVHLMLNIARVHSPTHGCHHCFNSCFEPLSISDLFCFLLYTWQSVISKSLKVHGCCN